MANVFLDLPAVINAAGAPVDTSSLGKRKTITVEGEFTGTLIIEISCDAGSTWAQRFVFSGTGERVLEFAANRMRVRSEGASALAPFAPNIDVGANDDGGMYGVVPAPPANGVGAVLNISAYGGFTTLVVQGEFSGVIGLQISNDGNTFSELATFGAPGLVCCRDVVGAEIRAVSRGANAAAAFTPVCTVGAINDPSGGGVTSLVGSNCFIFQPGGGGTGPTVFADWATLVAAITAARSAGGPAPGGCFTIMFDDSVVSPAVVPAGVWDMTNVIWTGGTQTSTPPITPVAVSVTAGATLTALNRFEGSLAVSGNGARVLANADLIVIRDGASVAGVAGGPFFDGSALAGTDVVLLVLSDVARLGDAGGFGAIDMPVAGSVLSLSLGSEAVIEAGALDISAGAIVAPVYRNDSARVDEPQAAVLGAVSSTISIARRRRPTAPVVGPAATAAAIGDLVRVDPSGGAVSVALPAITPFTIGKPVEVKNITGSLTAITITPSGADTIEGAAAPLVVTTPFAAVQLVSDGVGNWDLL